MFIQIYGLRPHLSSPKGREIWKIMEEIEINFCSLYSHIKKVESGEILDVED
jgi:hypothetical protein